MLIPDTDLLRARTAALALATDELAADISALAGATGGIAWTGRVADTWRSGVADELARLGADARELEVAVASLRALAAEVDHDLDVLKSLALSALHAAAGLTHGLISSL